jgi:DNA-binding CsgD family transcriptional regulator
MSVVGLMGRLASTSLATEGGGPVTRHPRKPAPEASPPADPEAPRISRFRLGDSELAVFSEPLPRLSESVDLTPAEQDICLRLLEGQSSREIARERQTATRTVANQIAAIFEKLGVSSRAELIVRLLSEACRGR